MTEALVLAPLVLLVKLCQDAKFYAEHGYGPPKAIEIIETWRKVCGGLASPPHLVHAASRLFERARMVQDELRDLDEKFPGRPMSNPEPYSERIAPLVATIRERYAAEIVRHVLDLAPPTVCWKVLKVTLGDNSSVSTCQLPVGHDGPCSDRTISDTVPPTPTDLDELSDARGAAQ